MKVGTDSILLATWCNITGAKTILDVGTGSGIIALLLASRSKAMVHAVELDENSFNEAKINFNNFSGNQPSIFHDDFNNYARVANQKYDLIISNPPYFTNSLLPQNESRKAARHTNTLNHEQLCKGVASLLSKTGGFYVVLPYDIANDFISTAAKFNLYLHKQLIIYPKPGTQPNRVNMEFRFSKLQIIITENMLVRDENNNHSVQYKSYVSNYLTRI
ncbi:MAG: methyltransferase [Bacteroidota bacterium]